MIYCIFITKTKCIVIFYFYGMFNVLIYNIKRMSDGVNIDNWKEYEYQTRKMVDKKIEQMEKDGKNTDGNLSNKLTTKMNIGATKESTIVCTGQKLSQEMNEALGQNSVSYTNTTNPFSTSSMSFNGDEIEGLLTKIIQFFIELFFGRNNKSTASQEQRGEIKLDKNKEYQIVGINKDFHSTAVEIDNVNKLVVGYDPNGNFNPDSFYNLLSYEDLAYLKSNGYQFINANNENKNKGTFTGMCGVLTTDWIEQELKTKLDERKQGITHYSNRQEIDNHYALVNQKNNPDTNRMMARNRVHFLMSKGENIETLREYNENNTIKLSKIQQVSTNNTPISINEKLGKCSSKTPSNSIMITNIKNTSNRKLLANTIQTNLQNNKQKMNLIF